MTTLNITVTTAPEAVNFRYLGDVVPAAERVAKRKPKTTADAAKPEPIATITDVGACGAITVNNCRVRCFFSGEYWFYSLVDIARAFGKKPERYTFLPGFVVYARTPHSGHQFMKWVEYSGLVEYVARRGGAEKAPEFGVFLSLKTYKQL